MVHLTGREISMLGSTLRVRVSLCLFQPKHQNQCHRVEDVHPIVFTLPRAPFRRQTRAEFFWKSFGEDFSKRVFCSLAIGKKDPPYLLMRKQCDADLAGCGQSNDFSAERSYSSCAS